MKEVNEYQQREEKDVIGLSGCQFATSFKFPPGGPWNHEERGEKEEGKKKGGHRLNVALIDPFA